MSAGEDQQASSTATSMTKLSTKPKPMYGRPVSMKTDERKKGTLSTFVLFTDGELRGKDERCRCCCSCGVRRTFDFCQLIAKDPSMVFNERVRTRQCDSFEQSYLVREIGESCELIGGHLAPTRSLHSKRAWSAVRRESMNPVGGDCSSRGIEQF